jgi:glycerol-3-phosphate acyltransferase PlsX
MSDTATIAIDAMGGDYGPSETVRGAVQAVRAGNVTVLLVGDEAEVHQALVAQGAAGLPIKVIPSEGTIVEGEHPARALRSKPKSSIAVSVGLVKQGVADAFVSMGSTGASMAAAVFMLGKFPGLDRPTLGGPFIGLAPTTTIIDLGANVDCKPAQLLNFGALGASFQRFYLGFNDVRVGLLSVGSEEGKGNRQVQEAFDLFKASGLNFVGNVEGHEVFQDKADVIVCDGFVGNVLLKFTEGLAEAAARYLAGALGVDSPAVKAISGLTEAAERGGGPLFGIDGLAVVGHGRTKGEGIAASVALAKHCLEIDLVKHMREDLAAVQERAGISVNDDAADEREA